MSLSLHEMRQDYSTVPLIKEDLSVNPFESFKCWLKAASEIEQNEVNAMALATTGGDLQPTLRMVLLKEVNEIGFVFYTNYNSIKGRNLNDNPKASLLFHWPISYRQIRIEGVVKKVDESESEIYFDSRPNDSKAAAILSKQSEILDDFDAFNSTIKVLSESGKKLVKPKHWGGYIVIPERFEFWQGGVGRVHSRFEYKKIERHNSWNLVSLYP